LPCQGEKVLLNREKKGDARVNKTSEGKQNRGLFAEKGSAYSS